MASPLVGLQDLARLAKEAATRTETPTPMWAVVAGIDPVTVMLEGDDTGEAREVSADGIGIVEVGQRVRVELRGLRLTLVASPAALPGLAAQVSDAASRVEAAQQAADDAVADATAALLAAAGAVTDTFDEYATSTSATVPPSTGWSASTPPWTPGAYIWRRPVTTKGDGSTSTGEPVLVTGNAGTAGTDAAVLRIDSSRGTAFKNSAIATVLTVTVFAGSEQITDIDQLRARFGLGAYLEWWWRRIDDTDFGVISVTDPRLSRASFALTVSPADVDEQTVFQCILHT